MREMLLDVAEDFEAVQDEPALEIALPQVFTQPALTTLRRGKLRHVEALIEQLAAAHAPSDGRPTGQAGHNGAPLGPDYQLLVNEFQPLFAWATACWDYLLSTEGCRFLLRNGAEKLCSRGDYRAVTDTDYSRLVHRVFRQCVLDFPLAAAGQSFTGYLRAQFWEAVLETYRRLEDPPDPRQRTLTPYSYLRCSPYQFLNAFHHELVHRTIRRLPPQELGAVDRYFLQFYTLPAAAEAMAAAPEAVEELLRRALLALLVSDRLVYCLLRQIERY
ncbi:MAG: hypothetical protein HYY91_06790 [Candidatus Omnitrophica bacterium]|nr:hypothetical protein [Candidatus Omnitrophota bacterium]